jgi:hypothetical protein
MQVHAAGYFGQLAAIFEAGGLAIFLVFTVPQKK